MYQWTSLSSHAAQFNTFEWEDNRPRAFSNCLWCVSATTGWNPSNGGKAKNSPRIRDLDKFLWSNRGMFRIWSWNKFLEWNRSSFFRCMFAGTCPSLVSIPKCAWKISHATWHSVWLAQKGNGSSKWCNGLQSFDVYASSYRDDSNLLLVLQSQKWPRTSPRFHWFHQTSHLASHLR